ncbi:DUF202 domain-containing protein [Desulfovibrio aminophilus]|nr:DUF202 domain-containing protein [Desulfovibrio aminophilus]MCM0755279.1 DUF202 domain-containing protein [Desulfovibrio aminophilus]
MKNGKEAVAAHDCQDERDRLARTTTHLANTRTYLAWVRTAIALMAFGFVLERVDLLLLFAPGAAPHPPAAEKLGLVSQFCFGAGAVILLLSAARTRSIALRIGSDGTKLRGLAETVILLVVLALALYFAANGKKLFSL